MRSTASHPRARARAGASPRTVSAGVAGRSRARPLAAATAAALALAACTPADREMDPAPTAPAPTQAPGVGQDEGAPPAVAGLPDGPAGEQAAWLIGHLAEPPGTAIPEPEQRFSPELLAELPAADLEAVMDQVRAWGPFTPAGATGSAESVEVRLGGDVRDVLLQVAVDAEGRVAGLWFGEAPPPRDPAASWEELTAEVDGLAGLSSLLVARVSDGVCEPLHGTPAGTEADGALPVGSVVKLWVLLAVVDAVGRGDLAWQDTLTVTDDVRSLPSGELQDAPEGTEVTVEEAAQGMIAISDNTATDLLVHTVGRDAVVEAMAASGHHDPSLNDPLPTTRELFQLGWGGGAALREEWRDADAAGRAALLDGLPGGPVDVDVADVTSTAVWPSRVDWFATAADVCAVHAVLRERAGTDHGAPVAAILGANPGLTTEAAEWSAVAFKGGSAPGTIAGSWLVEGGAPRDDGSGGNGVAAAGEDVYAVVLLTAARTPQGALPGATMVAMAEDALRLLRKD